MAIAITVVVDVGVTVAVAPFACIAVFNESISTSVDRNGV